MRRYNNAMAPPPYYAPLFDLTGPAPAADDDADDVPYALVRP